MLPASEPTVWRMLPASEPTVWRMLPASEPTLAASATSLDLSRFPLLHQLPTALGKNVFQET